MNPDRIRVVLHRPSHPGNIGAAARAMKTMGLSRLALVQPRRFPDREADALAVDAVDLVARASVHGTLKEALEGVVLAIAFSARARDLSHTPLDARSAAVEAVGMARTCDVALVFGNETAGLANQDVLLCNRLAHIPTVSDFSSLNLAAAVQVVAYEVHMASGVRVRAEQADLASIEQVEHFYAHLESSLGRTDFLEPGKPKRMMERMRRLFGRARLQREEVNILRGMLTAWDRNGANKKETNKEVD
ncbi:MAG: RNA methyltransferase [Betaproteobacteria bacterium]|nr:RNA methyltransferase [Betaproteobacteria bacterium]